MILGPEQVIACPSCGASAKYLTLISGNTFGQRMWTDGKRLAPMLPEPPIVVQCRSCPACFWLESAPVIGTINPFDASAGGSDVLLVMEPTEAEYYLALQEHLATTAAEERILRTLAWRRRNDQFRGEPDVMRASECILTDEARLNLERLLTLLDEDDVDERITRAEILRELGRFSDSMRMLVGITEDRYWPVVQAITSLCAAEEQCVRELWL